MSHRRFPSPRPSFVLASLSCLAIAASTTWLVAPANGQPERNTPGQPSAPQPAVKQPEPAKPGSTRPAPPRDGLVRQPGERGPGGPPGRGPGGEFRNLDNAMKVLDRGLTTVEGSLEAADQRERVLATISQMQRAAIFAKEQKLDHLPAGTDPKKAGDEFRVMGADLLAELAKLEKQIITGDTAGAKASLKAIGEIRDAGHTKFAAPEEEKHEDGKQEGGGTGGG